MLFKKKIIIYPTFFYYFFLFVFFIFLFLIRRNAALESPPLPAPVPSSISPLPKGSLIPLPLAIVFDFPLPPVSIAGCLNRGATGKGKRVRGDQVGKSRWGYYERRGEWRGSEGKEGRGKGSIVGEQSREGKKREREERKGK